MQIVWTKAALDHLEEIQDHIAQDSPLAAYRLALNIVERTDLSLSEHPLIGRVGRARGTRELILANISYIVVYRAAEDRAEILAIVHAARDWPESF